MSWRGGWPGCTARPRGQRRDEARCPGRYSGRRIASGTINLDVTPADLGIDDSVPGQGRDRAERSSSMRPMSNGFWTSWNYGSPEEGTKTVAA
jgi:hypothetical protein